MLKLLKLILVICIVSPTYSQTNYFFWKYTAQNGLISSQINCINQDTEGNLWIGTDIGVSKFDGAGFSNFNSFDNLASNSASKIVAMPKGNLFILHENGTNSIFKDGEFFANKYKIDSITDVVSASTKEIIITSKNKLYLLSNYQIKEFPIPLNGNEKIQTSGKINDRNYIIVTNENLYIVAISDGRSEIISSLSVSVKKIIQHNDLIYAFNNEKFYLIDKNFDLLKSVKISIKINSIAILENRIIASTNNGIYELVDEDFVKVFSEENGLAENEINSIFIDNEKTMWLGTSENGILGLPFNHFPVIQYNGGFGNLVKHISINRNDYLVFDHAITTFKSEHTNIIYQNNTRKLTCFFQTNEKEKWIGTTNGLLITFPGTNIEYEFKELRNQHVLYIRQIYPDNITIVTTKTVYIYHPSTNRVIELLNPEVKSNFPEIRSVIRSFDGLYLFGPGNVLYVKNMQVEPLFNWDDKKLQRLEFNCFSSDQAKETFWIGTLGRGIIKYKSKNNYTFYTEEKNIPVKYVNSVNLHKTNLWIGSNKGLVNLDTATIDYKIYNDRYFSNVELLPESAFPIRNQEKKSFYLLSKKGLLRVDVDRYYENVIPNLKINGFNVSGRDMSITDKINLEYDQYPISIDYAATSLSKKVYYQYKLVNYQNNWSQPTTQTKAEFLDLPPDKYVFNVRLINPTTGWVGEVKKLEFTIDIPFWRSPFFYFLVGGGFLILLALAYFARIIRLKVQKKRLQTQVERKTFQLSLQKKHLEQLSYSLSHDLKNPVNNIKGLVEIMEENRGDDIIKMLSESTNILEGKILSTLSSIKKAQANVKEITKVDFLEVQERVEKSLLMLIKENNATVVSKFTVKNIYYEESLIESIIYNLVSNAIKYRHPDRKPLIKVTTVQENNLVKLSVSDNGLGLDLSKDKDAIFSIFKRVHKNAEGTGIGLYMIKQMVEINGGSINLTSEPGKGTTFFVYLKHLNK